jgi:hypothetical protein
MQKNHNKNKKASPSTRDSSITNFTNQAARNELKTILEKGMIKKNGVKTIKFNYQIHEYINNF